MERLKRGGGERVVLPRVPVGELCAIGKNAVRPGYEVYVMRKKSGCATMGREESKSLGLPRDGGLYSFGRGKKRMEGRLVQGRGNW